MRYVIGHITVRPGTREEFLAQATSYVAASRADLGCVYFDLAPKPDDPDGLVMIEHWTDLAAHLAHQKRDYALAFQPIGGKYILRGSFEEMSIDKVENVVLDLGP